MKILFKTLALLLLSPLALADLYVRDGGSGSGTSWSDALDQIPTITTAHRGQTIWVADGIYSGVSADFSDSSTSVITVKKATGAEHGTETGWLSTYGDGVANLGRNTIRASYFHLDGSVGGGPGSYRSGHGFVIDAGDVEAGYAIKLNASGRSTDHVTVSHTEMFNSGNKGSQDAIKLDGDNFTLRYSWIHDTGRVGMLVTDQHSGSDNGLVEYSVIEKNGVFSQNSEHSELIVFSYDVGGWVVRYSEFADFRSTGGLMLFGQNTNMEFYGNVWRYTGWYTGTGGANGLMGGLGRGPGSHPKQGVGYDNIKFYNNVCYGFNQQGTTAGNVMSQGNGNTTNLVVRNNLFVNCNSPNVNGDADYNHYINSVTVAADETNGSESVGDPFVDSANGDFRLSGALTAGQTLAAPFNVDPNGDVRGSDSFWDRGAYELGGAGNAIPTAVIGSDVTSGTSPVTVNFNSTGSADSDGTIAAYEWDFKDGSALGSGATVQHVFTPNGTYDVSLRVQDDQGAFSGPVTLAITVTGGPVTPVDPTITPVSGSSISNISPVVTCSTTDSVARYTIDGTTPTATSTVLGSLSLSDDTTFRALCELSGLVSGVVERNYELQPFIPGTSHESVALGQAVTDISFSVVVSSCDQMDAVIGLSEGISTHWDDQVGSIRFYNGTVDYISGGAYAGSTTCIDGEYGVLMNYDLAAKTYDITLTNPNSVTSQFAVDAGLRTQSVNAASLNYITFVNELFDTSVLTVSNINISPGATTSVARNPLNVPCSIARPVSDYSKTNGDPLDLSLGGTFNGGKADFQFAPVYTLSGVPSITKETGSAAEIQKGRFTAPSYGADEVVTLTATCDNTLGPLVTETWNVTVGP